MPSIPYDPRIQNQRAYSPGGIPTEGGVEAALSTAGVAKAVTANVEFLAQKGAELAQQHQDYNRNLEHQADLIGGTAEMKKRYTEAQRRIQAAQVGGMDTAAIEELARREYDAADRDIGNTLGGVQDGVKRVRWKETEDQLGLVRKQMRAEAQLAGTNMALNKRQQVTEDRINSAILTVVDESGDNAEDLLDQIGVRLVEGGEDPQLVADHIQRKKGLVAENRFNRELDAIESAALEIPGYNYEAAIEDLQKRVREGSKGFEHLGKGNQAKAYLGLAKEKASYIGNLTKAREQEAKQAEEQRRKSIETDLTSSIYMGKATLSQILDATKSDPDIRMKMVGEYQQELDRAKRQAAGEYNDDAALDEMLSLTANWTMGDNTPFERLDEMYSKGEISPRAYRSQVAMLRGTAKQRDVDAVNSVSARLRDLLKSKALFAARYEGSDAKFKPQQMDTVESTLSGGWSWDKDPLNAGDVERIQQSLMEYIADNPNASTEEVEKQVTTLLAPHDKALAKREFGQRFAEQKKAREKARQAAEAQRQSVDNLNKIAGSTLP